VFRFFLYVKHAIGWASKECTCSSTAFET